tara:strand:+ start:309 stop:563 length:255 start_codon:yes stop_codon:yes gene_type:complete
MHKYAMVDTTIRLQQNTKVKLDMFKEYKNESYDEVINKLVYIIKQSKDDPELSAELILKIEEARERIKRGNFVTEKEAMKRLGM